MGKQRAIYIITVITLFQTFNLVQPQSYGSGSSGRTTTTTTTPPPNSGGWSSGNQDQWGGVGSSDHREQPNRGERPTENYNQGQAQTDNDFGKANFFSRETHLERYGHPFGCVHEADPHNTCNYYVEISKHQDDPQNLYFELSTHISDPNQGGYVAVGLSKDQLMGEDHMVECVKLDDGTTRAYHSWAAGRRKQPTRLADDRRVFQMHDSSPSYDPNSKMLTCMFTRPIITHVEIPGQGHVKFDLERGKYYVLLAVGSTPANSDQLGYHGNKPLETGNAYVSPNLLGYSQEQYPSGGQGQYGFSSGNGGEAVTSYSFVQLFFPLLVLFH